MILRRFFADKRGVSAVEVAIVAPIIFVATLSAIDLGLFVWRWNEAMQAARLGVRIAAISDPVSSDLRTMTGLETGAAAGQPAAAYERQCSAQTQSCSNGVYDPAAMSRIVYGPGSTGCGDAMNAATRGMCDVFDVLQPGNVTVTYRASGIDAVGTTGALRPLVTVRIAGSVPRLVIFDRVLPLTLPPTEATAVAEDLRTGA